MDHRWASARGCTPTCKTIARSQARSGRVSALPSAERPLCRGRYVGLGSAVAIGIGQISARSCPSKQRFNLRHSGRSEAANCTVNRSTLRLGAPTYYSGVYEEGGLLGSSRTIVRYILSTSSHTRLVGFRGQCTATLIARRRHERNRHLRGQEQVSAGAATLTCRALAQSTPNNDCFRRVSLTGRSRPASPRSCLRSARGESQPG